MGSKSIYLVVFLRFLLPGALGDGFRPERCCDRAVSRLGGPSGSGRTAVGGVGARALGGEELIYPISLPVSRKQEVTNMANAGG